MARKTETVSNDLVVEWMRDYKWVSDTLGKTSCEDFS